MGTTDDRQAELEGGIRRPAIESGARLKLELSDIRRGPTDDKYLWRPFKPNDEFNPHWWDDASYLSDSPHYVQVQLGGAEVARVELDHDFRGSAHLGAPKLGDKALEIQLIEVAKSHRGQGIGTKVVQLLIEQYSDHRILAMSEDADDFWASLGWQRYDHRDGPQRYRPLFIAPA